MSSVTQINDPAPTDTAAPALARSPACPDCGAGLVPAEGCWLCMGCGYSPCAH